jgi:uncharacterized integral membrane protein
MWIIRWILVALLIIVILGFALQNQEQTVSVNILKWKSPVLPLYLFLYLSFIAGLLFWILISVLHMIKLKGDNFQLQRENQKIRNELNRLRNASIDEMDEKTEFEPKQDANPDKSESKLEENT